MRNPGVDGVSSCREYLRKRFLAVEGIVRRNDDILVGQKYVIEKLSLKIARFEKLLRYEFPFFFESTLFL